MLRFGDVRIFGIREFYEHFDLAEALEQTEAVLRFAERNLTVLAPKEVHSKCYEMLVRVSAGQVIGRERLCEQLFSGYAGKREDDLRAALQALSEACEGETLRFERCVLLSVLGVRKSRRTQEWIGVLIERLEHCATASATASAPRLSGIAGASEMTLRAGEVKAFAFDPDLRPAGKDRIRTVRLHALREFRNGGRVHFCRADGTLVERTVPAGETLLVNAVGDTVVSILSTDAELREALKGAGAPAWDPSISSVVVLGEGAYVFVKDGRLDYTRGARTAIEEDWGYYDVAQVGLYRGTVAVLDVYGRVYAFGYRSEQRIASLSKLPQ